MHFSNTLLTALLVLGASAVPTEDATTRGIGLNDVVERSDNVETFTDHDFDDLEDLEERDGLEDLDDLDEVDVESINLEELDLEELVNELDGGDLEETGLVNGTESTGLEKRACSWNDGYGKISCNSFSLVFNSKYDKNGPRVAVRTRKNRKAFGLNCKGGGKRWTSIRRPQLKWSIDVHPGNVCKKPAFFNQRFDNLWVKYSKEFLDVPTDRRCKKVKGNAWRRCIIARKP